MKRRIAWARGSRGSRAPRRSGTIAIWSGFARIQRRTTEIERGYSAVSGWRVARLLLAPGGAAEFLRQLMQELQEHSVGPAESDDVHVIAGGDLRFRRASSRIVFLANGAVAPEIFRDR